MGSGGTHKFTAVKVLFTRIVFEGGIAYNPASADGRWNAELSLGPGSHTLAMRAVHPLGRFVSSNSTTFRVDAPSGAVSTVYDNAGYVTTRSWSNCTQTLKWDAAGRLASVVQRDGQNNGFNWTAVYDPLGRRLRTIHTPVTAGASGASTTIDSFYDPEVEFEEVCVAVNGARTWKVMGPDIDGSFGGWQGLGGLEATVRESDLQVTPVIQDHFGNVVARIVGGQALWSSNRVDGYGPLLGYSMPKLSDTTTLAEASVWRGKRMDPTGFYYLGARHYEPVSGRFLSPDPAGHEGSFDLYSFANGDPVNFFDPDGRLASGMRQGYASGVQYGTDSGAFSLGYRLGGVLGGLKEGWEGGGQITANNLTFGATDALGLTQSENYQGWEYTGSRYLSTIGRELLITAGTLGTAQAYRATGYGLYGGLATGGEFYSTYQNLSGVAAGFENLQDGNAWGLLQIGGGALGLRGNYAAATQLTGYKLAIDPMRFGTPLGNLKAVPIAAEGGLSVATDAGGQFGNMQVIRTIQQGEKIADIISESKALTFSSGNEVALVKLASGERALVTGGSGGINFGEGQITRIFGHTHPYQVPPTGPSALDVQALQGLGQKSSYILEHGQLTKFGVK